MIDVNVKWNAVLFLDKVLKMIRPGADRRKIQQW